MLKVSLPAQALADIAELTIGHDVLEGSQQRYIYHFCVRDTKHAVQCWGNGHQGQLGPDGGDSSDVPVTIERLPPASQLALGSHHSCALTTSGEVLCWGSNEYGQLGIGKGQDKVLRPTKVPLPGNVTQIAASNMDTCALGEDHEVYCWGENLRGEAGASNRATRIAWTPHHVEVASGSRQLSASDSTTCAIKLDGKIICWGYITDKLGPTYDAATSGEVPVITDATALAVGYSHVCAIRKDATLWCWGKDEFGQLGDGGGGGTANATWQPRQVPLAGHATQVVANKHNTCARLEDHHWYCWGSNQGGAIAPIEQSLIAAPTPLDLSRME